MAADFLLTEAADEDLQEIKDYICRDSVRTARRVIRELKESMLGLAKMPGKGHVREDLTAEDIRFWTVYSYSIVYRPQTTPLEIVRVLSGRRDVKSLLGGEGE